MRKPHFLAVVGLLGLAIFLAPSIASASSC
jgi:hypothetical protein